MSMGNRAPGQHWETADPDVRGFVGRVVRLFEEHLGGRLVGVYLHGSLAMSAFRRAKSDLDLLVVVTDRLSVDERRALAHQLVALSDTRPTLGDLELSIIQQRYLSPFVHPTPYELHYSIDWKEAIRTEEVDFSIQCCDPDLAAHCTVTRTRGVCLVGPPIEEVFGPVPAEAYLDSVLGDFDWLVADDHILESPYYGVLNLCRVLQLLHMGPETVVSKEEGAWWALAHVPPEHHPLIHQALSCYQSAAPVPSEQRKTGGMAWGATILRAFRDYAASEAARLRGARPGRRV